ncbi:MAG: SDR family NAD(P)-dependent oxidoreductase [Chloroflexi bacterium]|nr:SDR family NAD(P)-dependent oxidoreductase [Chloroflexota bacterium]
MDRVVIVTGATGKLGPEIARRFGATGAKVVVNDNRQSSELAEGLAAEINKGPGKCFAYKADVRRYEDWQGMVEETLRRLNRIDVVVNLAGGNLGKLTGKENKLLLDHNEEDWDLVIDVNLKGTFNCLRAVAPQMIKQREGHFILISSLQGVKPRALVSSYSAAKAGVFGLMKAAALEFGQYNIKVNAVNPGGETPVTKKDCVLGRFSTQGDLADFIVYLSQTDNISGQTFHVGNRIWV